MNYVSFCFLLEVVWLSDGVFYLRVVTDSEDTRMKSIMAFFLFQILHVAGSLWYQRRLVSVAKARISHQATPAKRSPTLYVFLPLQFPQRSGFRGAPP